MTNQLGVAAQNQEGVFIVFFANEEDDSVFNYLNASDRFSSFLSGYASVFDYRGGGRRITVPDLSKGMELDYQNLSKDWLRVGGAIDKAMRLYAGDV